MNGSRFATLDELGSIPFNRISFQLQQIHIEYGLPDHSDVNRARYPWSRGVQSPPEIYASRLWEYPFAILEGRPEGKTCVDIGCGMSAFTLYLHSVGEVIGVDPDLFKQGVQHLGHGVSQDFLKRTGLDIRQSTQELHSDHFDRVFCISVIEHVPRRKVDGLAREMARILKPGGLLVMTVDVNIEYDMARPMDLIWQSGLEPKGLSLAWPTQRLGRSDNLRSSADVYGLVLEKPVGTINANYSPVYLDDLGPEERINQSQIPIIRARLESEVSMPLRVRRYLKAEWFGR